MVLGLGHHERIVNSFVSFLLAATTPAFSPAAQAVSSSFGELSSTTWLHGLSSVSYWRISP